MPKPLDVPNTLKSIDAQQLHSLVTAFIFVSIDALHIELRQIQTLLPNASMLETLPPVSAASAAELAVHLDSVWPFPLPPTDDELRDALSHLQSSQIQLLISRLRQLAHCLVELKEDHHCQLLAVSPVWFQRWRLLIEGRIHPAYIGGMFF